MCILAVAPEQVNVGTRYRDAGKQNMSRISSKTDICHFNKRCAGDAAAACPERVEVVALLRAFNKGSADTIDYLLSRITTIMKGLDLNHL